MLYRTHLAFGLAVGVAVWQWGGWKLDLLGGIIFFGIVAFGSLFPDLDHPKSKLGHKIPAVSHLFHWIFGHRGFLHSIFFIVLLGAIVILLTSSRYGFPLMVGLFAHVLSDCLTTEGVNLIHPFHQLSVKGFIETGSLAELIVFFGSLAYIAFTFFGTLRFF